MPLVYQQIINATTKLGVWHIVEPEGFFLATVPLQRAITHPNKRLQHLAGRYLLRELFPGFPYGLIRVADTRKPFLENEAYHFSIAHCGNYAAAIVSTDHRVGVDVEFITGKAAIVKHKYLTWKEQKMIEKINFFPYAVFKDNLLTAAWCIKESLFKWQAESEVDFKKHLVISEMSINDNEGIARCSILKHSRNDLDVRFLFFGKNCLSWVLSPAI